MHDERYILEWRVLLVIHNFMYFVHFRYAIMLMCWKEDPRKRPTFSELRAKFDAMLLAERNDEYIDLRISNDKPYYMLDTSATLAAAANHLHPSPSFAAGQHSILLSELASKECSPQPLPTPDLSPSCKSHTSSTSVQFSPTTCKPSLTPCFNSISELSTDAEGRGTRERNHMHDNGRPSSLLLPRERERWEKQDRYVDEPSRTAATTLALPDSNNWSHTHGGSDGAIELMGRGNMAENCIKLACPEIKVIDEKA